LQKRNFSSVGERIGLVDAVLKLPEPTGQIPIDSKFPLENYRRMIDTNFSDEERKDASKKFKSDLKDRLMKHQNTW